MSTKEVIELISAIVWPLVVITTIIIYRKSLSSFLLGIGSRITKITAFEVSFELATLPATPQQLTDIDFAENSAMTGGDMDSTTLMEFTSKLEKIDRWDYLLIDIKVGRF